MKRLFCIVCCLAALTVATAAAAQPKVTAVRMGAYPDKTRFVMELSESPGYRVFTLPDPFRVVIDLPEIDWSGLQDKTPKGQGLVEAMRFGLFAPGTSRVVLDVKAPVRLQQVFLITPQEGHGHRFVIDLAPVSRETFFAGTVGKPVLSKKPLETAQTAALPVVPPRPKADERPTIVIDPGHGGVDPGAIGVSGTREKALALTYAHNLKSKLEKTGRYRVVLTRSKDIVVGLRDRVEIAQKVGGDLFISLHANTHKSGKIRGASIYSLSEKSSDKEAEALAAKENKADIIAGIDLSNQTEVVSKILIDLAQRETMNSSKQFANIVVGEIGKVTRLLRNTHRFAGFAVLKSATVPSILAEIGYMSNRKEEELLKSASHREKITAAIVQAVTRYFEQLERLKRS